MTSPQYFLMSETLENVLFNNGKPNPQYFYNVDKCVTCNSSSIKKIFKQWGISYFKCDKCEMIFSNPRLTGDGAYHWYNSDYYNAAMKEQHFIAEKYDKFYSASLPQELIKQLLEMFLKCNIPLNAKIADIGCGSGALLHQIRDVLKYNNIYGFDLNENNASFAKKNRKLDIKMKDVYDLSDDEKFDAILTTENIEHVSDPHKYLETLSKILNKDGYLILSTPHNDKAADFFYGNFADHYCAPNHQNYFNIKNLTMLLNQYNLTVENYFLFNKVKFNLILFLKRYFLKRDQITCYPPYHAELSTIWKFQKDLRKSVRFFEWNEKHFTKIPDGNIETSKSLSVKIKKTIASPFPYYFKTHQIVVSKLK